MNADAGFLALERGRAFSRALHGFMSDRRLTAAELAREAGIAPNTLRVYLGDCIDTQSNTVRLPRETTLKKLSQVLEVPEDDMRQAAGFQPLHPSARPLPPALAALPSDALAALDAFAAALQRNSPPPVAISHALGATGEKGEGFASALPSGLNFFPLEEDLGPYLAGDVLFVSPAAGSQAKGAAGLPVLGRQKPGLAVYAHGQVIPRSCAILGVIVGYYRPSSITE